MRLAQKTRFLSVAGGLNSHVLKGSFPQDEVWDERKGLPIPTARFLMTTTI